jgi:hypothetical protein
MSLVLKSSILVQKELTGMLLHRHAKLFHQLFVRYQLITLITVCFVPPLHHTLGQIQLVQVIAHQVNLIMTPTCNNADLVIQPVLHV